MTDAANILDCGHASTSGGGCTGYAITTDNRKICYACCAEQDKASMRATGYATLYLAKRGDSYHITNWPGTLDIKPFRVKVSKRGGGFGSQRTDAWFNFEGATWHAINRGNMDIARCKRTRAKAR